MHRHFDLPLPGVLRVSAPHFYGEGLPGESEPAFVERLDAWTLQEQAGMELPPIMIYGEDVTHILTEEGIANLLLCRSDAEREQAIRGVAGYTAVGLGRDRRHGRPVSGTQA